MEPDGLLNLLHRIADLARAPKTKRGQYPAERSPYKPILLLTVMRRLQLGAAPYSLNRIEFESCERDFARLYEMAYGQSTDLSTKVSQAFWYLGAGTPQIWHFESPRGSETELDRFKAERKQVKSASSLARVVDHAYFGESDWRLLCDPYALQSLIAFTIECHFVDIRDAVRRF